MVTSVCRLLLLANLSVAICLQSSCSLPHGVAPLVCEATAPRASMFAGTFSVQVDPSGTSAERHATCRRSYRDWRP